MESVTKHTPIALLALFIGKLLFFGCNGPEMGVATALVALVTVKEYIDKSKKLQEIEAQYKADFHTIKTGFEAQNKVIATMAEEVAKVKTQGEGVKLAMGMRKLG